MAETYAIYNGIALRDVLTESIDQTVVPDSTGVDPLYVRVEVTFSATAWLTDTAYNWGIGMHPSLAQGFNAIIAKLMQPRRAFRYIVAGQTLINCVPAYNRPGIPNPVKFRLEGSDINNGPIPSVRIQNIISGQTARVQMKVICHMGMCDSPSMGANTHGIINLRYWIGEDINGEDWTTLRTYSGRLRVAHAGVNVHQALRSWLVIPPLQTGFWRKSIRLHQAPNGLELDFTVEDQELYAQAPWPATSWDGEHMVSSPYAGGAIAESELRIQLKGEKTTDKKDLFSLATKILDNKLHLFDMQNEKRTFLLYAAYRDKLKHNHIEAVARIRHVGKKADWKLWNVPGRGLGEPLTLDQYNKEVSKPGKQTATLVGLFAQRLQDACHPAKMPQECGNLKTEVYHIVCTDVPEETQGMLTPYEPDYSPRHLDEGAYTDYTISSEIKHKTGMVDLPVGDTSGGSGVNSNSTILAVPLHQGWARREVRISAERLNAWPEVPDWGDFVDSNDIAHTVLDHRPIPAAPCLSADGKKSLYRIDQELLFSLSRPPRIGEDLPVGKLPYRGNVTDTVHHSVLASAFIAHGTEREII